MRGSNAESSDTFTAKQVFLDIAPCPCTLSFFESAVDFRPMQSLRQNGTTLLPQTAFLVTNLLM